MNDPSLLGPDEVGVSQPKTERKKDGVSTSKKVTVQIAERKIWGGFDW